MAWPHKFTFVSLYKISAIRKAACQACYASLNAAISHTAVREENYVPLLAYAVDVSCAREKGASKLVEADSHDSVCSKEGLFNPIPMMDVDINIQHPLMVLQ